MTKTLQLVTHNGPFHADDVFAAALLTRFSRGVLVQITRTRDEDVIRQADVVIDVGGVYDPATLRFDHHQFRSVGERKRSRFMPAVPLSSAGMVLEHLVDSGKLSAEVGEILYRDLIAEIDLLDNGEGPAPAPGFPQMGGLSKAVSRMNPNWDVGEKNFDAAFLKAVTWAKGVVRSAVSAARAQVKARSLVEQATREAGGDVLVMNTAVPGATEIALDLAGEDVKYIVQPSDFGGWMVLAVPPSRERRFEQKVPLPANWAGLRGDELNAKIIEADPTLREVLEYGSKVVPSAVFCHTGRFCCGHGTRDAALIMAVVAASRW